MTERLQKFLSRAGVASRRRAEELILAGRVKVNNQTVTELGTKVEPGQDLVQVDDRLVTVSEERAYYVLYKPAGYVTTLVDPEGRPTVADLIAPVGKRVYPVGRLDFDAEGALLLTDDGDLAHRLMHPSFLIPRTYLAKVKGTPDEPTLEKLRGGVRLEDGTARPLEAAVFEQAEKNTWLKLVVGEGRTHLVKRLCAAVGHPVVRLFRPHHAGVSVEGLKPGAVRPLSAEEVAALKDVAAGKAPLKEPSLRLPPRRHGRAGDGEGEGEGEEAAAPARPARPPRPGGERRAFEGRPRRPSPRFGDRDRFAGDRPREGRTDRRGPRPEERDRFSGDVGRRRFDRAGEGEGGRRRPGFPGRKPGRPDRFGGDRPRGPHPESGDRGRPGGDRDRFRGDRPRGPRPESGERGRPGGDRDRFRGDRPARPSGGSRPGDRRPGGPPGRRPGGGGRFGGGGQGGGKGAPRPGGRGPGHGPPRGPRGHR